MAEIHSAPPSHRSPEVGEIERHQRAVPPRRDRVVEFLRARWSSARPPPHAPRPLASSVTMVQPMPREAPVTRAIRSVRGLSANGGGSPKAGEAGGRALTRIRREDRARARRRPEPDRSTGRILAGEMGVAELVAARCGASPADGAVEAVDREERQTVDADVGREFIEAHPRRDQLTFSGVSRRCMKQGRPSAARRCACAPSRAPASRTICTIFREAVPRTIESSTRMTRALPLDHRAVGIVLELTPMWRNRVGRLDEGAADVVIAWMMPRSNGRPAASAKPIAAGLPESGTGMTTSASIGDSSASSRSDPLAHRADAGAAEDRNGRAKYALKMQKRELPGRRAERLQPLVGDHSPSRPARSRGSTPGRR